MELKRGKRGKLERKEGNKRKQSGERRARRGGIERGGEMSKEQIEIERERAQRRK